MLEEDDERLEDWAGIAAEESEKVPLRLLNGHAVATKRAAHGFKELVGHTKGPSVPKLARL